MAFKTMDEDIAQVVYTVEQISDHVKALGSAISKDYAGRDLVLVGLLRGASIFMADLARQISLPLEMDYMIASSYGSSSQSSGVVRIIKDLSCDIRGRDVIIVEDLLDTGITLKYLKKNLLSHKPASLKIACCFMKQGVQKVAIALDYPTLPIPDRFVVGYGLDYAQRYRNLPYLGVLDSAVLEG